MKEPRTFVLAPSLFYDVFRKSFYEIPKNPLKSLEDSRQIVVVFAFCYEFTMQTAGFGNGFQ